MDVFKKNIKVSMSLVILLLLLLFLAISVVAYWCVSDPDSKWGTVIGSLTAGIVVAIIQFIIAWQDFKQTEKLKELKLIKVLYNRSDRRFYEDLIKGTKKELDVMGVTAKRLFDDFADTSTGAPDSATALIQALDRGVRVRVLLPESDQLPETKRVDVNRVRTKCKELSHYQNLEVKYFSHIAAHSVFRLDDICIIGPVFPELESRNTPALVLQRFSPMAMKYMDYFDAEWKGSRSIRNA